MNPLQLHVGAREYNRWARDHRWFGLTFIKDEFTLVSH